jgi:hypothetical protein
VTAAVVREQGVTFAVVAVKPAALRPHARDGALASVRPRFPGLPVVLMAQDTGGAPTYYGRRDISLFLARVLFSRIPWREYDAA